MFSEGNLTLTIIFSIVVFASNSCLSIPSFGLCENTVEKQVNSPDGEFKAVIFDRGCGATVGFITGISIIPANEKINNNDTGNILFAEKVYGEFSSNKNGQTQYGKTNFDIEWINDEELLVYYTESKRLSKTGSYKNIKIIYKLISK